MVRPDQMQEGKWYWILFRIPGIHRKPQETVVQYLGVGRGEHLFSLRPLAGTSSLQTSYIIRVELAKEHKPLLPRIYREA